MEFSFSSSSRALRCSHSSSSATFLFCCTASVSGKSSADCVIAEAFFVELAPVVEKEFAHLPGLEPSRCFHLFLSHAWPLGQDVCKLIKHRCHEICPSLHVFLDVEDLTSGSGTREVDHSRSILVFAMPVYFEKINCIKELTRSIVRNKPITLLLPDAEVHGEFTQVMIEELVTDEWVHTWKLQKKLAEWAADWGVAEVKTPTAKEVCNALFKQPPLEWSRITPFQDRTLVLTCQRLLPEGDAREIYLQGASSFKLHKKQVAVKVYCSAANPGARDLAEELNKMWPGLLDIVEILSWSDLSECDYMLVHLNGLTWTHEAETLATNVREAQRRGLRLQLCHEFPSVIDAESLNRSSRSRTSSRHAMEFKQIMDATPRDLRQGRTNIYSKIAISLKGGEMREPGLANLATRIAVPKSRTAHFPDWLAQVEGGSPMSAVSGGFRSKLTRSLGQLTRRPSLDRHASRDIVAGAYIPEPGSPASKRHATRAPRMCSA